MDSAKRWRRIPGGRAVALLRPGAWGLLAAVLGACAAPPAPDEVAKGAPIAVEPAPSAPPRCPASGTFAFVDAVLAEKIPKLGLSLRQQVAEALLEESDAAALDACLILGLIHVESRFDVDALSWVGARGLMQMTRTTARYLADLDGLNLSDEALFEDVEWQVRLSIRYLSRLLERFKKQEWMLMAYNAGPEKFERARSRRALDRYRGYPKAVFQAQARCASRRQEFLEARAPCLAPEAAAALDGAEP